MQDEALTGAFKASAKCWDLIDPDPAGGDLTHGLNALFNDRLLDVTFTVTMGPFSTALEVLGAFNNRAVNSMGKWAFKYAGPTPPNDVSLNTDQLLYIEKLKIQQRKLPGDLLRQRVSMTACVRQFGTVLAPGAYDMTIGAITLAPQNGGFTVRGTTYTYSDRNDARIVKAVVQNSRWKTTFTSAWLDAGTVLTPTAPFGAVVAPATNPSMDPRKNVILPVNAAIDGLNQDTLILLGRVGTNWQTGHRNILMPGGAVGP